MMNFRVHYYPPQPVHCNSSAEMIRNKSRKLCSFSSFSPKMGKATSMSPCMKSENGFFTSTRSFTEAHTWRRPSLQRQRVITSARTPYYNDEQKSSTFFPHLLVKFEKCRMDEVCKGTIIRCNRERGPLMAHPVEASKNFSEPKPGHTWKIQLSWMLRGLLHKRCYTYIHTIVSTTYVIH